MRVTSLSSTPVSTSRASARMRAVASSFAPRSRKRRWSTPQRSIVLVLNQPARCAARAYGRPELPAMRVRSRSKNAAARAPPPPPPELGAIHLEHDRVALATTRADRRAAEAAAAAAELVDEGAHDPPAGGADRVAQRDRAAVHVDPVLVDAEHPHRVKRHRREGLVDLPEVHVL